jgi:hypothetical protein
VSIALASDASSLNGQFAGLVGNKGKGMTTVVNMADNVEERRERYAEATRLRDRGIVLCYYCHTVAVHWKPGFPEDGLQCLPLCEDCLQEAISHGRRQLDEILEYGEAVTIREAREEDDTRTEYINGLRREIGEGLHPGWRILENGANGIVVYNWPDDLASP